jgi:hypothetical protein
VELKARIKRERAATVNEPMRPLKSIRGPNGNPIYLLDSDSEEEALPVVSTPAPEPAQVRASPKEVTLD